MLCRSESHGCIELFVLFGVLLAGCHRAADAEDASATDPGACGGGSADPGACGGGSADPGQPRGRAVSFIFRDVENEGDPCAGLPGELLGLAFKDGSDA